MRGVTIPDLGLLIGPCAYHGLSLRIGKLLMLPALCFRELFHSHDRTASPILTCSELRAAKAPSLEADWCVTRRPRRGTFLGRLMWSPNFGPVLAPCTRSGAATTTRRAIHIVNQLTATHLSAGQAGKRTRTQLPCLQHRRASHCDDTRRSTVALRVWLPGPGGHITRQASRRRSTHERGKTEDLTWDRDGRKLYVV